MTQVDFAWFSRPEGVEGLAVSDWIGERNVGITKATIAALDVKPGHAVLELGCGTGGAALLVADPIRDAPSPMYTGIDHSDTVINECRRKYRHFDYRVSFHTMQAERLAFPNASFDRVFSVAVGNYWKGAIACLMEAKRVLKPGGICITACLHPDHTAPWMTQENGFYIRDETDWYLDHELAGFGYTCKAVPYDRDASKAWLMLTGFV